MRGAGLARRRNSALTFWNQTNKSRPSPASTTEATSLGWTLVSFSNKAGLDTAVANLADKQYIYYNGTGTLTISSSSGTTYKITGKSPATGVVFDFGTYAGTGNTNWGAPTTGNYVIFDSTSSSDVNCFTVDNSTNLTFFGGYMTNPAGNQGIIFQGPLTNCNWYDPYVYHVGGSGVSFKPITDAGAASYIRNGTVRAEVNRFALAPNQDSHTDKGTGLHGFICHGSAGELSGMEYIVYAHDPLSPGEVSNGQTWSEGSGGAALEDGTSGSGPFKNNTYYVLAENMLMKPATQTGGNAINWWGTVPLSNTVVGWVEGNNLTGALTKGTPQTSPNGWQYGSPAIVVKHGRYHNINQYTGAGNISTPYDTANGNTVTYQDMKSY